MSAVERVIILAAGKSLQLDGVSKVLVRHPYTERTILDYAIEAFEGKRITVVVGFRAIQVMQAYPQLEYVHNPDWALTNNAMSLGLALDDEPAYVIPGDIFLERSLVDRLDAAAPNVVLASDREKRSLSAIHCVLDSSCCVQETYQGPVRNMEHPEAVGLFKISDADTLLAWRRRCVQHSNLFAGQLLPCDLAPIRVERLADEFFYEINTPVDYLELLQASRPQ